MDVTELAQPLHDRYSRFFVGHEVNREFIMTALSIAFVVIGSQAEFDRKKSELLAPPMDAPDA